MLEYDHKAPAKSWLKLALCFFIVCSGTVGASYLALKIHWIAAAVVAVPAWILLVDVLINRQKTITWYLLDFFRFLLSFAGTAVIAWYLWKKDWRISVILVLPVFIVLLNAIGFLALPMYGITKKASVDRDAQRSLEQFKQNIDDRI
jgi:hypothetical protein